MQGLKDERLSNRPGPFALVHKRNARIYIAAEVANNLIAFQDRPEHLAPRKAMTRAFKSALANLDPQLEEIGRMLLDRLRERREWEVKHDFAADVASLAICRLMGLPDADAARVRKWSSPFFLLFHAISNAQVFNELNRSLKEFRTYFHAVVEEKMSSPGEDFVSKLLREDGDGYRMPVQAIVDNCMLIAADGVENVQAGIASAIATLLSHPEELAKLQAAVAAGEAGDALVRSSVGECLRYESPGQYQMRIATADTEIGGRPIRRHSVIALSFAEANRDPEMFDEPDRFMIDRQGPRHLAFGAGHHGCLGAALVEREFAVAFRLLFDGSRRFTLRDPEIKWQERVGHRWPEAVNVSVEDA